MVQTHVSLAQKHYSPSPHLALTFGALDSVFHCNGH